ncbi:MAG TPA: hypothetical protein VN666_01280 [Nitrospira sp.]|nr:hypothetical protein [Nitrospira sp.]
MPRRPTLDYGVENREQAQVEVGSCLVHRLLVFTNTLKLSDKVDQLNATLAKQQTRIEDLNTRASDSKQRAIDKTICIDLGFTRGAV